MAKPKKTARPVRGQSYSSGGNGADDEASLEAADMCGTICATPSPIPHKMLPVHIFVKTGRAFKWPSYHAKKEKPLALVVAVLAAEVAAAVASAAAVAAVVSAAGDPALVEK